MRAYMCCVMFTSTEWYKKMVRVIFIFEENDAETNDTNTWDTQPDSRGARRSVVLLPQPPRRSLGKATALLVSKSGALLGTHDCAHRSCIFLPPTHPLSVSRLVGRACSCATMAWC